MADFGRVHAVVLSNREGQVIYERFYDRFSEGDKAEIRAAFAGASQHANLNVDEMDFTGLFRGAGFVFMAANEIVVYALGSGEYHELALAEILRTIIAALRNVLGSKALTEALLFEKYGKLVLAIDEVIYEGILDQTDIDAIRKGTKGKLAGE